MDIVNSTKNQISPLNFGDRLVANNLLVRIAALDPTPAHLIRKEIQTLLRPENPEPTTVKKLIEDCLLHASIENDGTVEVLARIKSNLVNWFLSKTINKLEEKQLNELANKAFSIAQKNREELENVENTPEN